MKGEVRRMTIREKMAEDKRVGYGLAAACALVAMAAIGYQLRAPATGQAASGDAQYYFSADDGKTFFKAPATSVPPFDYQGKPAVRAYVYRCGNGEPFVGYLERYKEEARRAILAAPRGGSEASYKAQMNGREVKRPGDREWVNAFSGPGARVTQVPTPKGQSGTPEVVEP